MIELSDNYIAETKASFTKEICHYIAATDPGLESALDLWSIKELTQILERLRSTSFSDLIREVQMFRLPDDKLPLSEERHPFEQLDSTTVERVAVLALAHPDKQGDLTAIVHGLFGVERNRPENYTLLETHVNVTDLSTLELNVLVSLGFEPDNFYLLQPACYTHNFTLAFSPTNDQRDRYVYLQGYVAAQAKSAAELIQDTEGLSGFYEAEVYPSTWVKKYKPYCALQPEGLLRFPFGGESFEVVSVPCHATAVIHKDVNLETRKRADVHVKLPTLTRLRDYPEANSLDMILLREKLLEIGFYEIVSYAGNAIYTGQFLSGAVARAVFEDIDAWAQMYGGIIDLVCEPCTAFWRKRIGTKEGHSLAEVSPVLLPRSE